MQLLDSKLILKTNDYSRLKKNNFNSMKHVKIHVLMPDVENMEMDDNIKKIII